MKKSISIAPPTSIYNDGKHEFTEDGWIILTDEDLADQNRRWKESHPNTEYVKWEDVKKQIAELQKTLKNRNR